MQIPNRLRGWAFPVLLLTCAGALGALHAPRPGGDVNWLGSYRDGVRLASAMHRPMLLSFDEQGTSDCSRMDAETYVDPKSVNLLQDVVCVRIERGVPSLANHSIAVHSWPFTVLIGAHGNIVWQKSGYISPVVLQSVLSASLQR